MAHDISTVANFIRGGVNGAIGAPHLAANSATTAAGLFQQVVQGRIDDAAAGALPEHVDCPAAAGGPAEESSPVAEDSEMLVSTRLPPEHNDFSSLLNMCHAWVGIGDGVGFRDLWHDVPWR